MAEYGYGMPLDIGSPSNLWKGKNRTNGFLMRAVDGRIPALKEGFSRIIVDAASPLYIPDVIPWGNGLWREINQIDTAPGTLYAQAPSAKPMLVGILKFEQAWQDGNPVQPYGLPSYSRGTLVRKGLVGYKTSLLATAQAANYLEYLKGDGAKDVSTVRHIYPDWVAAWKAGAAGSKLGLFFDNTTGFPRLAVIAAASLSAPALAGASFAGFAEVFEKENETIFFDINL